MTKIENKYMDEIKIREKLLSKKSASGTPHTKMKNDINKNEK